MFKHLRWRQSRIISLHFSSNDVVLVLCDDASLWAVNVQDTSIHEVLSDRVCVQNISTNVSSFYEPSSRYGVYVTPVCYHAGKHGDTKLLCL